MCGICGEISFHAPPQRRRVDRMVSALSHRGPDDSGIYEAPRCTLGHRRLSIIDLEHGRQPVANEDETVWVVCNGEIYNYRGLRDRLLTGGHRFRTQADTEVIVHLYEDRGADCVQELRGMFAFAIWDVRAGTLLLARDRFGQKPLFYTHDGGRLLFASEVKALLAASTGQPAPDELAIHDYLSLRFLPHPRTMFQGVRCLPPAHVLAFDGAEPRIRRYWELPWRPKPRLSVAEQRDRLHAALVDAVRSHLVSDVPVGAFLSGGVDSSLVTAIAAREFDRPLPTFAVGSDWQDFSELPYARRVAEHCGTEHHEVIARPDVVEVLPRIVWQLDQPGDPITACVQCAAELAGQKVKVVLSGDGGDELFGGYDRLAGLRWADRAHRLPRPLRLLAAALLGRVPAGHGYKTVGQRAGWFAAMMNAPPAERYALATAYFRFTHQAKRSLYTEAFWGRVSQRVSEDAITRVFAGVEAENVVDRMLATDVATRLPAHLLLQVDRLTMAVGLEARSPLLDHELAQVIASFPAEAKVRGGRLKALMRDVARIYLPADIVNRPKQGFMLPISHWLRGDLGHQVGEFLRQSRLVEHGYFVAGAVHRLLVEHRSGRRDHHHRLWMLLNLEIWWRLYVDGLGPAAVSEALRTAGRSPRADVPVATVPKALTGDRTRVATTG